MLRKTEMWLFKGSFVTKINELFELQKYDQNLTMNWKISQSLF